MKVQVVEKVVTEVRERRIEVPHPRSDCIDAVLYDNDALVQAMWVLIDNVADQNYEAFSPAQSRFWDLYNNNVEVLYEALVKRAAADDRRPAAPDESTPRNKHRRNMQLMTRRHPPMGSD